MTKPIVFNGVDILTDVSRKTLIDAGCEVRDVRLVEMEPSEFLAVIPEADAVIAAGERYTEEVFEAGRNLRIVARTGAGVDTVDFEAGGRHGVWVTNTPGATSPAVAEMTLGLMLSLLRNLPRMDREMKQGVWRQYQGRELGSLTVGIVGAGSIGKKIIELVRALGAKVLAYDLYPDEAFAQRYQVRYVDLDELLASSDMVSLNVSLTEGTAGLIDAAKLDLMKPTAYLVNTSRPTVVDHDALVKKLESGGLAGAAIDVHNPVPCDPKDPLIHLDNVVATPWCSYKTGEAIDRMCTQAVIDVLNVLFGRKPQFPVNQVPEPRDLPAFTEVRS